MPRPSNTGQPCRPAPQARSPCRAARIQRTKISPTASPSGPGSGMTTARWRSNSTAGQPDTGGIMPTPRDHARLRRHWPSTVRSLPRCRSSRILGSSTRAKTACRSRRHERSLGCTASSSGTSAGAAVASMVTSSVRRSPRTWSRLATRRLCATHAKPASRMAHGIPPSASRPSIAARTASISAAVPGTLRRRSGTSPGAMASGSSACMRRRSAACVDSSAPRPRCTLEHAKLTPTRARSGPGAKEKGKSWHARGLASSPNRACTRQRPSCCRKTHAPSSR